MSGFEPEDAGAEPASQTNWKNIIVAYSLFCRYNRKMKSRKKRSKMWLIPEKEFRALVADSINIGAVLRYFGYDNKGRNNHIVKMRCKELNIDTSHFNKLIRPKAAKFRIPLEKVLVKDCPYSIGGSSKIIKKSGILKKECYECGLISEWNKLPLTLQLDHINGDNRDNRIENIRLLCPNCHSQTPNFAGRSLKKEKPPKIYKEILRGENNPKSKLKLKDIEEIRGSEKTNIFLAKKYGVSDSLISRIRLGKVWK